MAVTPMQGRNRRTDLINNEAERQYLAWLLMNNGEGLADDRVTTADFWSQPHAYVFSAIIALHADDQPIDTITVRDKLNERDQLAFTGEFICLEITETVPMRSYASLIRRLAAQRRVQTAAQVAAEMMGTTRESEGLAVLEAAQAALRELRAERDEINVPSVADPFRGCPRLRSIAVVGRERLLALARTPVTYSWTDIAVAGTVVVLAGGPSEGKTTLLFLILGARAAVGGRVTLLGRDVEPAPAGRYILLIEGEHSERSTARKLVSSLEILGVPVDSALDRVIIIARKSLTIGSPEWQEVAAMVRAGLISDIAIDTIARCSPADANDEAAQVAIFKALSDTIEGAPNEESKPTVWLVAHTKKGADAGLEGVSGSAQRVGQADSVLIVRGKKVKGRTVSSRVSFQKLRETPDIYPDPVDFALVRDVVDGAISLQTTVADSADDELQRGQTTPPPAPRMSSLSELIYGHLQKHGAQTRFALRMHFRVSEERVRKALHVLEEQQRVCNGKVLIGGRKREVIQLVEAGLYAAE